jgi:20S proteasome alpha/beta subunit
MSILKPLSFAKARPLLPSKLKRLTRGVRVTIAAGFQFDEGVLVCADTKHTAGMNLYETKLFAKPYSSGAKSIFAIAGASRFARMAVSDCEKALSKLKAPEKSDMEDAVKETLIKVHEKHIFRHPDRGVVGGPDFNLMIALWSAIDGLGMYSTEGTALDPIATYDCAGAGAYLGHYIIRPRYRTTMGIGEVFSLATTALQRIKAYDQDCGGYSEVSVLTRSGELSEVERFDISQSEELSTVFYAIADSIYAGLVQAGQVDDEEMKRVVDLLVSVANKMREQHELWRGKRDFVIAALDKLKTSLKLEDEKPSDEITEWFKKSPSSKSALETVTALLKQYIDK